MNYFRYLDGTSLSLTAIPNEGYRFVNWSGDVNFLSPSINVLVNSDLNITANFTLTTHTVVLSVNPEGAGSVAVAPVQQTYTYGSTITLTAQPSEGYWFVGWTGDIENTENPVNVVVKNNLNIVANFKLTTHTVSVIVTPKEAAQVNIQPQKEYYTYGDEVTISFTKNKGWDFLGWSGNLSGYDNPLSFIVKSDVEIIANFKLTTHTLLVEINPENAGFVIKEPDEEVYTYGTTIKLTAIPNEGFWFDSWSGDSASKDSTLNINIEGDIRLSANFVPSLHTINTNVAPFINCGSVSKQPQKIYYVYGSTVTLTATPNEGWEFIGWSVDSSSITEYNNPLELTVRKDLNINAHFKLTTHTVITSVLPNNEAGSILVSPQLTYYLYGTNVKFEALANPGWEFVKWSGDVGSYDSSINISVKKNLLLYATFRKSTYTITIDINPYFAGKVLKTPDSDFYYYGTTVTLTAVASRKFKFENWSGDFVSNEKTITLQVYKNMNLLVNFVRQKDFLLTLDSVNEVNNEIYFGSDVEKVEIYDSKGKLIHVINGNKWNGKINDKSISIGFYILKIKTHNNEGRYEKLVVVR